MAGPAANSDGSSAMTEKVRTSAPSFAAPLLMAVAQPVTVLRPESSSTDTSAPFVNVGGSLTAGTSIVNVWVPLCCRRRSPCRRCPGS